MDDVGGPDAGWLGLVWASAAQNIHIDLGHLMDLTCAIYVWHYAPHGSVMVV